MLLYASNPYMGEAGYLTAVYMSERVSRYRRSASNGVVRRTHAVASESANSDHVTTPELPEPDVATFSNTSPFPRAFPPRPLAPPVFPTSRLRCQQIGPGPHTVKTLCSPLTKHSRLKTLGSPISDRPTTNPKATSPLVARAVRCPRRPSRGLDR